MSRWRRLLAALCFVAVVAALCWATYPCLLRAAASGRLAEIFRSAQVDPIRVRTDEPYVEPIVRYFQERARRFR